MSYSLDCTINYELDETFVVEKIAPVQKDGDHKEQHLVTYINYDNIIKSSRRSIRHKWNRYTDPEIEGLEEWLYNRNRNCGLLIRLSQWEWV